MSTSQDSTPDIATDASPQPKRIVLPHRTKTDADKMGKGAGKQKASQKLQKGSKKGQRLDLKTLLHGAPDEGLESKVEGQDNKGASMTSLRLKSTGPSEDDTDLANFDDTAALPQTTTKKTEYDYDDEDQVDSNTYDDDEDDDNDDVSMPSKLPTQSRRSGKGEFWKRPLPRKDLVGAIDGALAPRKPATQKAKKLRRQEAMERYKAEDERQQGNARAGHGHGRLLGAGPGQFNRQIGGGRADT